MLKSCVYLFMWRNYEFQRQKSIAMTKINFKGNVEINFKNLILKIKSHIQIR